MFSDLMKYSFNMPKNILEQSIFSILKKDKDILKGGGLVMNNYITMIIGIMMLIIGFIMYWFKNNLIKIDAKIQNIICNDITNNNNCKISITYIVNSVAYSKIIQMNKLNLSDQMNMTIYYSESDPNIIELYNFNHSIIGLCLIVLGVFLFILSFGSSSYFNISTTNFKMNDDSNIYTNIKNENGVDIAYS